MTSERRCVIAGCKSIGEHHDDCDRERCRGCQPRHIERGLVCNPDRTRLAAWLYEVPELHAELQAEPDPVDHREWTVTQYRPIPTADPARRPPWQWIREPGNEALATIMPMGITRTSRQARVSGSRETPAPANIDQLDLTNSARNGSLEIVGNPHEHPDQTGYTSIATELDFWVRDWILLRRLGEHLPPPHVADLAAWLAIRLEWACDEHPAIDEFAAKITNLRSAMRSVLGLTAAPKELCKGVACRSCDRKTLYRDGSYVTCGYCGQHYNEREYTAWVGLLAGQLRSRNVPA